MTGAFSFLSKVLGRCRRPPTTLENLLTVVVIARLNVRTIPEDRTYYYGEPLDKVLAAKSLGEVTDGGIMFNTDTGRIDYVDLEIGLQDSSNETLSVIAETLEGLGAPVGSFLEILPEKHRLHFGRYEGMSLALDRAGFSNPGDPSDEVNDILLAIEAALVEVGAFRGYWEGESACELYFYGPSFDDMRASIASLAKSEPRLAQSAITQIA